MLNGSTKPRRITKDIIGNSNMHDATFANCALIGYSPGMPRVVPCLIKPCLAGQRKHLCVPHCVGRQPIWRCCQTMGSATRSLTESYTCHDSPTGTISRG